MKTHPTILDVAESSGVSKSTVSNVIRGTGKVSPETRRRVLESIALLGYRPNAVARNLVQRRTSTFSILVGDLGNPFYSELAKLVEQRASEAGYSTLICNTDGDPEQELSRVGSLLEQRVAGVAMLQFSGDRSVVGELVAHDVPLVVVSCWEERSDCVAVDDVRAGRLATEHLLELGHRRIEYLSSALVEPATDASRCAGYREAMEAAGLEPRYRRWEELDGSGDLPTGFFVSNDVIAIRLLESLEERGRRVPADVSVVGFDDIALAGLRRISLTTVSQPREELARLAVDLLLRRIEQGAELPLQQLRLEPVLVVRDSSGPPR